MHYLSSLRSPAPRRSAFTLIELLVVISIIALLIGILLPALGKARKTANVLSCATRQQQLGRAMAVYQNDSDSYYPINDYLSSGQITWDDQLGTAGYDGRSEVGLTRTSGPSQPADPRYEIYQCPLNGFDAEFNVAGQNQRRSYSLSGLLFSPGATGPRNFWRGVSGRKIGAGPGGADLGVSLRAEDVLSSSNSIALTESLRLDPGNQGSENLLSLVRESVITAGRHSRTSTNTPNFIGHHADTEEGVPFSGVAGAKFSPNYLYADSHVETRDSASSYDGSRAINNPIGSQWDAYGKP